MAAETEVGELLHQHGRRTGCAVADGVDAWAALASVMEGGYEDFVSE